MAAEQQQPDPASPLAGPPPSLSPFQQPARDNAGNVTAPPQTHIQAPPVRRGVISDSQYDGLPPDQQLRYAMMKRPGDQGGSEWVARDQLAANPADQQQSASERVKVGDMEVSQAELQEFFKSKGEAELRKATLPAAPEAYEAKLPENFEMPQGVDFKIDEADPMLADARKWAHAKGFDQATFSEMVGIYAHSKATEQAQFNAAHAAEIAKMGANGTMRVTALEQWLRGVVGDKLAGPMRCMMVTADIVKGLETLQYKFSSQGASSPQSRRSPPEQAGRISEAEYGAMSPAARLDYTRQFDQKSFGPNRLDTTTRAL